MASKPLRVYANGVAVLASIAFGIAVLASIALAGRELKVTTLGGVMPFWHRGVRVGRFGSGGFRGWGGGGGCMGVRSELFFKVARAICGFTNHRNKGLISVNRRTSLLSHLQYPVPYQSRLQRI